MGFFDMLRKKKEIIPLIGIVVFASLGGTFSLLHALGKSDVIINKTDNPEPWDKVNPNQPQKLLSINQEWKPIEELEKVRKMMK